MADKTQLKAKFAKGKKPTGEDFAELIDGVQGEKGEKGDRGEKGEAGKDGSGAVESVNGKAGVVIGLAEKADLDALELVVEDAVELSATANVSANKPSVDVNSNTIKKPMVTFLDDDGTKKVLDRLKPLAVEKDVTFSLAIISNFMLGIGQDGSLAPGGYMDVDEVRDLRDNYNFEIQSHSESHPSIATVSEEQQWDEISNSHKTLNRLGFDVEYLIYPYGSHDKSVREKVSKVYRGALGTSAGINTVPIRTFSSRRVALGAFAGAGENTLEYYKSQVDAAIANNDWLVFMLHVGNPGHDDTQQGYLSQVIDYCKTKGVDIVSVKEGYERAGNVLDIEDQSLYIARDGTNNIRDLVYGKADTLTGLSQFNGDSLPKSFSKGKVTVSEIFAGADIATTPNKKKGRLITYSGEGNGIIHQEFQSRRERYFRQSKDSDNEWDAWFKFFVGEQFEFTTEFGEIASMSSVSKRIEVAGLILGHFVEITPKTAVLTEGLIIKGTVTNNGRLNVVAFNPTANPITLNSVAFNGLLTKGS